MDDVTTGEVCGHCQLVIATGAELTFGTHCFCKMPKELTEACEKLRQQGSIAVLDLSQIKQYIDEGIWPKQLEVVAGLKGDSDQDSVTSDDPLIPVEEKQPFPKTPHHVKVDQTVRILQEALEDAARERAEI